MFELVRFCRSMVNPVVFGAAATKWTYICVLPCICFLGITVLAAGHEQNTSYPRTTPVSVRLAEQNTLFNEQYYMRTT
jgi:hypothetical protein